METGKTAENSKAVGSCGTGSFRELVRQKQALPAEDCVRLLKNSKRGVLSVLGDNGYPYGVPLNHYYCEADGLLYFHSGNSGHKLDSLRRWDKASFCVYDGGFRREGEWALNISSVIVFGRVRFIDDREQIYRIARELSLKFTDDMGYIDREIKHSGPRTAMFVLVPENITGKTVNES